MFTETSKMHSRSDRQCTLLGNMVFTIFVPHNVEELCLQILYTFDFQQAKQTLPIASLSTMTAFTTGSCRTCILLHQ